MATSDVPASHRTHLQAVNDARRALEDAKRHGSPTDGTDAHQRLRSAVDAARDGGVTWMQIGDLLGIARGNAYQRYRRRPAGGRNICIA